MTYVRTSFLAIASLFQVALCRYSRSEILEKRESRSRPDVGIIKVRTTGFNQDGTVVISFERTIMVYKKGHAPQIARLTPDEG